MISSLRDPYRLDHLLRAAAQRFPDKCAVRDEDSSINYAELDLAADRVAAALADGGVQIGDRVALCLPKSVRAVAAIYGVMRAGAAYVPIDVGAPPTRSAYIATNCGLNALISDRTMIEALRAVDPAAAPRGICCDGPVPSGFLSWEEVQTSSDGAPARQTLDVDLAYILYTSGSTGEPKGVSIAHRSSLSFVRWARQEFELRAEDVLSSHAPFHFDLSIFDLFAAAWAGATVSLVPPITARFPVRLAEWIRASGITVWYSVPSALSMLVRYGELRKRPLDELRLVLFAGEVFPIRYLRELMLLVPDARFFNLYGPTETNVCTFHEVREPPALEDPPVPIGQACENDRCEVVDPSGKVLTEPDAEGELIIRGGTVAEGYWNDPERTARGFPAPHTYRTGDIVRIIETAPDSYRFVGRRDHMVKCRGYRVELGEVESALFAYDGVEECVVVAVPDQLMGNRLAAFCTTRAGTTEADLRRACRERVPGYMVPDRIMIMESLPRTPNDKYDRAGLAREAAALITE